MRFSFPVWEFSFSYFYLRYQYLICSGFTLRVWNTLLLCSRIHLFGFVFFRFVVFFFNAFLSSPRILASYHESREENLKFKQQPSYFTFFMASPFLFTLSLISFLGSYLVDNYTVWLCLFDELWTNILRNQKVDLIFFCTMCVVPLFSQIYCQERVCVLSYMNLTPWFNLVFMELL